jgi:hypothetical protein
MIQQVPVLTNAELDHQSTMYLFDDFQFRTLPSSSMTSCVAVKGLPQFFLHFINELYCGGQSRFVLPAEFTSEVTRGTLPWLHPLAFDLPRLGASPPLTACERGYTSPASGSAPTGVTSKTDANSELPYAGLNRYIQRFETK